MNIATQAATPSATAADEREIVARSFEIKPAIDLKTLRALHDAAGRRGWSVDYLAAELLVLVVESDLIDGVLDDGKGPVRRAPRASR